MRRVISAFRLLAPRRHEIGPLRVSADQGVGAEGIGHILDAVYVAVSKLRAFGFSDSQIAGRLHILARQPGELAHARYMPGSDRIFVFYPHTRGVEDWPWTLVHEIGHRVWHKTLQPVDRAVWEQVFEATGQPFTPEAAQSLAAVAKSAPQLSPLWFFFQKHFSDDPDEFRQWLLGHRYSEQFPTTYSMSSATEAFADVFAEAVLGRSRAGMGLRRTGSYIKAVFSSIVAPYRGCPKIVREQQDEQFLTSQVDTPSLAGPIARWVSKNLDGSIVLDLERRPHVTLVYGLDKRDVPQIMQIGEQFDRHIRLVPGALNYFDNPEHDVLYLEALGGSLYDLRSKLLDLPNTREQAHKDYVPHITVAYLKKGAARRFVGQSPLRAIVSRPGFTLIDEAGIETPVPTVPESERSQGSVLLNDVGSHGAAA